MARKLNKKRSEKEALQDALDKETGGLSSSGEELKSLKASSIASARRATWCGMPLPWKRGGRRKRKKRQNMGKFGFGRKEKSEVADDGDSSRSGLFGRRKPTPSQDDNPYAQQPAEDPYARMTPYQQARANLAAGPRGPPAGLPSGPSPSNAYGGPPPAYPGSPQVSGGYTPEKFGASGGYGGNRYDAGGPGYGPGRTGPPPAPSQGTGRFPARGPGGYGGLGPSEDDDNKDELLAGAKGRFVGQAPSNPALNTASDPASGAAPSSDAYSSSGGYGEQRELTAEELEDQEYQSIVNEGKQMKRDDVSSLQRSNQIALANLELITGTNARLGQQEDRLRNTEKNLDMARFHTKIADEKTRELRTLNRSMFAVHVPNPFTKSKREAEMEAAALSKHREERDVQETTRKEAYLANQQNEKDFKEVQTLAVRRPIGGSAAKAKRQKELMFNDEDVEEGELEDEIEEGIEQLSGTMTLLKTHAVNQGHMVERQNQLIDNLAWKSTNVDDGLAKTRAVMSRIR